MSDDPKSYVGFYIMPRVWLREKPEHVKPGAIDFDPLGAFSKELAVHLHPQEPVGEAMGEGYEVLFFQDGLVKTRIPELERGNAPSPQRHSDFLEYLNAIQLLLHVALLHHARHQVDIQEVTVGRVFAMGESRCGYPSTITLETVGWAAWMRPVLPQSGIYELVTNTHRACRDPILRSILAQLAIAASHFYGLNFQAAGTQLHRVVDGLWYLFRHQNPMSKLSNRQQKQEQEQLWEESFGEAHTVLHAARNDLLHNNDLQGRGTTPFTEELCTQGMAMASAAVGKIFGLDMRIGDGWGWRPWLRDS